MMNTHGEISEGWEGVRKGTSLPTISPSFPSLKKKSIAEAVQAKMAFNASRADHKIENRQKDGGKQI
jgi:hypothetical protein